MSEQHKVLEGVGKRRVKRTFEDDSDTESNRPSDNNDASVNERDAQSDSTPANMNELRKLARQKYLDKRELEVMALASRDLELLEEDVKKYGWDNLSTREQEEINIKRQAIQLVKDRRELEAGSRKGYHIIDRKEDSLQNAEIKQGEPAGKERGWEDQQLEYSVRAQDYNDKKIFVQGSDKYEFVLDDNAKVKFTDEEEILPGKREYQKELVANLETEVKRLETIAETRKSLPVYKYRDELLKAVRDHQVLIVVGETGSGKTTQLPQYLVEDGYTAGGKFMVACTQPRRVAAMSVASRVSDEMEVVLGKEVGYQIRFDDKTTRDVTILKYMTDGMLLREFLTDPELSRYSCIMIDEAHERTMATDILLGLLKDILPHRKDLKLLISSATMNASKFSAFFYDAPVFNIPGRRFPVDIHYTLQPEANYLHATVTTVFQIHSAMPLPGDILVFLTGQDEIENVRETMEEIAFKLGKSIKPIIITPIYSNLPQQQQSMIFEPTPAGVRKIVLATNIAETSLTIDGIKYVVDPGFVKENSYVPQTGMSQLLTVPCSKASVDQRAGRAGRVGPGKCFRLFTKWSYHNELDDLPKPEILRTNLSQVVLLLLSMGVTDLLKFPMLDKPSIANIGRSLEQLYVMGALNSKGSITKLGRIMCEFPCEPEFAKVIHSSAANEKCNGVLEEVTTILAMLFEAASIFATGKERKAVLGQMNSDHMLYLEIYNTWANNGYRRSWCQDHHIQHKTMARVRNIRDQLWRCSEKLGLVALNQLQIKKDPNMSQSIKEQRIMRSFITGFPANIAKLTSKGYQTIGRNGGMAVHIHPTSIVFSLTRETGKPFKYLLYQQLMLTSKEFMRDCMPIPNEAWLHEMVPHYYNNLG
ncbi:HER172Cp [Eremothecium sinecaudum]|uniref:RNA helicase n=1 Tax=Eremothecium sinecaudum TaxID=45286 RepID=A0A120K2G1_9SACH|nr:HER172Cp [Eremothecium sinecaudum]AMD21451.1 HER172Cp [Eremothecium sinecaudum]